ncbi:MAG TPA: 2-dehydropantoate 2-reductase [Candidatus Xenobia bacterium]
MAAARILVFGAGAIGQWVGARLALAGHSVTLLVRPRQQEAIQKQGIVLKTSQGTWRVKTVQAATDAAELARSERFEWIFVTTKAYDAESAMRAIGPLVDGQVQVVMFQNGLGSEEYAARTVGADRTWICSVTKALAVPDAGTVQEMNLKSGVAIAPYEPGRSSDGLKAVFTGSQIPVLWHDSKLAVKWSKLLLNILGNAVCAIVDQSTAAVFGHTGLFHLEAKAFREAVKVMQAQELEFVALPGYPVPLLKTVMVSLPELILQPLMKRRLAEARGEKVPSLRLDMQKSPPRSEVQYLNGAIAVAGARLGVRTPANTFITDTLQGIVDGTIAWDTYRKKPDVLWEAWRTSRQR